ncbi:AI-2E family transporter [Marivirga sp. S37H4]|uniref:AI-2E family transporter n=1 Tax=Marivirga aurantiaca TaxID=2802615 RepID=A0A934WV80_9BACT|nr:AI-2E family transporter [Marivirga aurantiaca]MBK6263554.1 AI-2E family transporter [Marivirga aurantiaca]
MNRLRPIFYLLGGLFILYIVGLLFADILIYIVISLIVATILRPLTNYLNSLYFYGYKLPKALTIIISFGILISFIALFVGLFVPLVSEQIQILSKLDYDVLYEKISEPIHSLEVFLIYSLPNLSENGFIIDRLRESILNFVQSVDVSTLINNLISFTGSFFVGVLAVSFITFFMLYEKGLVRRKFISLIPNKYFEVSIGALYKIESLLSNYLLGLLFQMVAIFTIASVGLSIFGIKYAVTIAVFAAVANLIPYAGPILGATFGIIVGVTTGGIFEFNNDLLILIVKIVSVFSIVQITDNILLQPLIFSKSVKAHPLEIFVIIFAGASLAGVVGMIAAIPVYTIIRVVMIELYKGYKQYKIFQN